MQSIRHLSVVALLGLTLAGCGKSGDVTAENESPEAVAKKVAAANIKPQPGRWESSVKLEQMEMEGVPPQAKEAMAKQMGQVHTFASCLTPEQVDQPDGGFFQGGAKDCTYKHFTMAGGRIDAEMTCGKAPAVATMTMAGTYSATNYDIKVNSQGDMMPGRPMKMAMSISSRRAGDCNGTEEK